MLGCSHYASIASIHTDACGGFATPLNQGVGVASEGLACHAQSWPPAGQLGSHLEIPRLAYIFGRGWRARSCASVASARHPAPQRSLSQLRVCGCSSARVRCAWVACVTVRTQGGTGHLVEGTVRAALQRSRTCGGLAGLSGGEPTLGAKLTYRPGYTSDGHPGGHPAGHPASVNGGDGLCRIVRRTPASQPPS